MNQYPSTLQICFLKYHEVLKAFDDALILIDDAFKLDVGYTPNQLTHAKWQTWAYLQMKQGNFASGGSSTYSGYSAVKPQAFSAHRRTSSPP